MRKPGLLVFGNSVLACGELDAVWPSCRNVDDVVRRLQGRPGVTVLRYRDGGHCIGTYPPYTGATEAALTGTGGTLAGTQAANLDLHQDPDLPGASGSGRRQSTGGGKHGVNVQQAVGYVDRPPRPPGKDPEQPDMNHSLALLVGAIAKAAERRDGVGRRCTG